MGGSTKEAASGEVLEGGDAKQNPCPSLGGINPSHQGISNATGAKHSRIWQW